MKLQRVVVFEQCRIGCNKIEEAGRNKIIVCIAADNKVFEIFCGGPYASVRIELLFTPNLVRLRHRLILRRL